MLTVKKFRSCFISVSPSFPDNSSSASRSFLISSFDTFVRRWLMLGFNLSKIGRICSVQRPACSFLVAICLPLVAHSAEVLDSSVTQQDGQYMMHTETVVQAPVSKVRALIVDYKNFPRLNADIKRVEAMEHLDDGGIRMGVRSSVCILSICQHFDWVQDIRFLPDGDITMTILPNQGDFREGNGRWQLFASDGGTRLIFDLDLTPKYWVPPLFGPWIMKRKLTEDAVEFAEGLETMANSN